MLPHNANLSQKEFHQTKYTDEISKQLLAEIRAKYNAWHQANLTLIGPHMKQAVEDEAIIRERVNLLNEYKDFIDQQVYAEHFDARSNLHSSVIEEFLFYLFKDLAADFGEDVLLGKSHTFKDLFFVPPNFPAMLQHPHARIEIKDHDFVIGVRAEALMMSGQSDVGERHIFDLPAVAIECKTYLDKTMLEGSATAASQLKARNPNSIYLVVMEWIKLTENINLQKYHMVDQIYVLRRQKNTDREFRFLPTYQKNPIYTEVVTHLFNTVRQHLTADWKGGVDFGLLRGWLMD